jgi:hypothetical protein
MGSAQQSVPALHDRSISQQRDNSRRSASSKRHQQWELKQNSRRPRRVVPMPRTIESRNDFLEKDLADALKSLYVAAVVWAAADAAEKAKKKELCPFLKGIAASASFVQARALYEFYNPRKTDKPTGKKGESAHASDFAPKGGWTEKEFKNKLYDRYLGNKKPANKRVFHLVYDRSDFSGGIKSDESDHLKNQPLKFALELHAITKKFIDQVEDLFRDSAKLALDKAAKGAKEAAEGCGISNPLA